MPFTLSHAAAALPFRKLKPIWPALVMGTFAPDLQHFIWISNEDRSAHHFPDVVLFTLPLALLVLWLFERVVKGPAIEVMPSGLQRRLQDKLEPLSFRGWKQSVSIILWIAAGISTHLLWDQFTHSYTLVTTSWDVLSTPVSIPYLDAVPLLKILQHTSTLLGFLVLCSWCAAWYRRNPPVPKSQVHEFSPLTKISAVLVMIVIALFVGYPYALYTLSNHPHPIRWLFILATVFEAITKLFCIELLVYGTILTVAARSRRLTTPQFNETTR